MKRFGGLVAGSCSIVVLAACSTSTSDFQDEAQKFIESDDVAEQLELAFSEAACEEPADTSSGTSFTCTANGADGVAYTFEVTISGDAEFTLNPPEPVG